MRVIEANNVRDALIQAINYIILFGEPEDSRAGKVVAAQEPVTIHYANPKQHVLLSPIRDANPFFHLMEAMWMLAGRDDSAFLDNYIHDFSARFAQNGVVMDSYGHRWKYGYRYNQLDEIVNQLRKEPTTRQCVLQMWGAGRDDLRAYSSKPCNLSATFRIQQGQLNMTVFNRSNDLLWGCCGANAVHFPILQEYIAGRVGIPIGEYWQITTNLHMYLDQYTRMRKRGLLDESQPEQYGETLPLITDTHCFDTELSEVMKFVDAMHEKNLKIYEDSISNTFLREVVLRMAMAHFLYKNKKMVDALDVIDTVTADDWKTAGKQWLERRNGRG